MKKIVFKDFLFAIFIVFNLLIITFSCSKHNATITKQENCDSIIQTISEDYSWKLDSIYFYSSSLEDTISELRADKAYYEYVVDSLEEELFVAYYKLERIKEYNRIAGQGNNITFLRGWINRVLND